MNRKSCIIILLCILLTSFTSAQSTSVGSTDGVFNVSDLGAGTYSIPVKVPSGLHGMQPNISINYNSQTGNGLLGTGWSMTGISAITRIGKSIYNNQKVTGISLDADDNFAIDGNRLILLTGSYGAANSVYRTEVESFVNVVANGLYNGGPESFTVTDQDGKTYSYGASPDSKVSLSGATGTVMWLLYQVTDLQGNYIQYTYAQSAGEDPRIQYITYSGNSTVADMRKSVVNFYYEARSDKNFSYIAGGTMRQDYRLLSIKVNQYDQSNTAYVVGSYTFSYSIYNDTYPYTWLLKITEKGHEISGIPEVLPNTEFSYGNIPAVCLTSPVSGITTQTDRDIASGDYNGDGYTDMIDFSTQNQGSYIVKLNNKAMGFQQSSAGTFENGFANSQGTDLTKDGDHTGTIRFDYNGDGKDDFTRYQNIMSQILVGGTCISYQNQKRYWVYQSNGTAINSIGGIVVPGASATTNNPDAPYKFLFTTPFVGDFDGDGKTEILLLDNHNYGDACISAYTNYMIGEKYCTASTTIPNALEPRSLGNVGFNVSLDLTAASSTSHSQTFVIDYNGDGKNEILRIVNGTSTVWALNVTFDNNGNPVIGSPVFTQVNSTGYPSAWHNVYTGDFNGDHITDVLTFYQNGSQYVGWQIGYGKGNGQFGSPQAAPGMIPNSPFYPGVTDGTRPIIVSDFNGDGRDDILDIYNDSPGSNYKLFTSKGDNGFLTENLPALNLANMGKKIKNYWVGDFNGDGQIDFVTKFESNSNLPNAFLINSNNNRNLISGIKNGLGASTKINYLPLTNSTVYNNSSVSTYTYPLINKVLPLKVVSDVNTDNGINLNGISSTYSYKALKYHCLGKGLLGFDNIASFNTTSRIKSEKQFAVNPTYAYPYLAATYTKYVQTNNITEEVLSSVINTYGVYAYANKRIFPYLITEQQFEPLTGQTTLKTNNYVFPTPPFTVVGVTLSQNNGKPFSITTNKGNGLDIETQTFSYPNYQCSQPQCSWTNPIYVYSRPSTITTTRTRLNQTPYTRTVNYTYNGTTGLLTQTVSDPGTLNAVTVNFEYDAFGNTTRKQETASGLPNHDSRTTYEPFTHRFVTETYDATYPNIKEKATYDLLLGNKLTETDPDGLQTSYTYDGFGRVKTAVNNNGKTIATSYTWGTSVPGGNGSIANSLFYTTKSSNDGSITYEAFDRLGRKLKTRYKNFQNQWINADYIYNAIGQLTASTKPYFTLGTTYNLTTAYDIYGRKDWTDAPEGTTDYNYSPAGNNYLEVTITDPSSKTKKIRTDASGAKTTVTDNLNNTLNYTYSSTGDVKEVSGLSSSLETYLYDAFGRLSEQWNPNYGTYKYEYNAYGQTKKQTDPKSQITLFSYDALGRMYHKDASEGAYDYTFNNNLGANCGKLTFQSGPDGAITYSYGLGEKINSVQYDDYGFGASLTGIPSFSGLVHSYSYDGLGRLGREEYSTGATLQYSYSNNNGELTAIRNPQTGTSFFEKQSENAMGQITSYKQTGQNDIITNTTYDDFTNLLQAQETSINGAPIRKYSYEFEVSTGNLSWRANDLNNLLEDFSYDDLDRLNSINNNTIGTDHLLYNANGNITNKTDAGAFEYDPANRLSKITDIHNIPMATQNVSYTSFNKVLSIKEDNVGFANLRYWPDGERMGMETYFNNGETKIKSYAPNYDREFSHAYGDRGFTFVRGPENNVIGMIEIENGQMKDRFILTDHLGSFTHILDDAGDLIEEKSFDAWGRLRNPLDWQPYESNISYGQPAQRYDRGYTGHEHLADFGIINMNGRLYDPVMGRMFSPDPALQQNDNLQNYNSYTYCLNNPLKYTDPTGKIFVLAPIAIAAIWGGLSGAIFGAHAAYSNGKEWYQGALWGGVIGAATGVLAGGTPLGTGWVGSTIYGAGLGATSAGLVSYATGGGWSQVKNAAFWGGITGGVGGFMGSEQFGNLMKRGQFISNNAVVRNFRDAGQYDEALNYFGFKGKFDGATTDNITADGNAGNYLGYTDPSGNIYYGKGAFLSYDNLKATYYKELYHATKIANGGTFAKFYSDFPNYDKNALYAPEERAGFIYQYKHQGLYPHSTIGSLGQIDFYQNMMGASTFYPSFQKKWWEFIYKIPRRW